MNKFTRRNQKFGAISGNHQHSNKPVVDSGNIPSSSSSSVMADDSNGYTTTGKSPYVHRNSNSTNRNSFKHGKSSSIRNVSNSVITTTTSPSNYRFADHPYNANIPASDIMNVVESGSNGNDNSTTACGKVNDSNDYVNHVKATTKLNESSHNNASEKSRKDLNDTSDDISAGVMIEYSNAAPSSTNRQNFNNGTYAALPNNENTFEKNTIEYADLDMDDAGTESSANRTGVSGSSNTLENVDSGQLTLHLSTNMMNQPPPPPPILVYQPEQYVSGNYQHGGYPREGYVHGLYQKANGTATAGFATPTYYTTTFTPHLVSSFQHIGYPSIQTAGYHISGAATPNHPPVVEYTSMSSTYQNTPLLNASTSSSSPVGQVQYVRVPPKPRQSFAFKILNPDTGEVVNGESTAAEPKKLPKPIETTMIPVPPSLSPSITNCHVYPWTTNGIVQRPLLHATDDDIGCSENNKNNSIVMNGSNNPPTPLAASSTVMVSPSSMAKYAHLLHQKHRFVVRQPNFSGIGRVPNVPKYPLELSTWFRRIKPCVYNRPIDPSETIAHLNEFYIQKSKGRSSERRVTNIPYPEYYDEEILTAPGNSTKASDSTPETTRLRSREEGRTRRRDDNAAKLTKSVRNGDCKSNVILMESTKREPTRIKGNNMRRDPQHQSNSQNASSLSNEKADNVSKYQNEATPSSLSPPLQLGQEDGCTYTIDGLLHFSRCCTGVAPPDAGCFKVIEINTSSGFDGNMAGSTIATSSGGIGGGSNMQGSLVSSRDYSSNGGNRRMQGKGSSSHSIANGGNRNFSKSLNYNNSSCSSGTSKWRKEAALVSQQIKEQQTALRPTNIVKKQELSPEEQFKRNVRSLLNKLTVENFLTVADKIALLYESLVDFQEVEAMVNLVHQKAVTELDYTDMYADLAFLLKYRFNPMLDAGSKSTSFHRCLLNRCQVTFEEISKVTDVDQEDPSSFGNKKWVLGNIRFMGELFLRKIISISILKRVSSALLHLDSDGGKTPCEHLMECFTELLTTIGYTVDQIPGGQEMLNEYMYVLNKLKKSPEYSVRISYKIQDLLDLREKKWQKKLFKEKATSVAQVHLEAQQEELKGGTIHIMQQGKYTTAGLQTNRHYSDYLINQRNCAFSKMKNGVFVATSSTQGSSSCSTTSGINATNKPPNTVDECLEIFLKQPSVEEFSKEWERLAPTNKDAKIIFNEMCKMATNSKSFEVAIQLNKLAALTATSLVDSDTLVSELISTFEANFLCRLSNEMLDNPLSVGICANLFQNIVDSLPVDRMSLLEHVALPSDVKLARQFATSVISGLKSSGGKVGFARRILRRSFLNCFDDSSSNLLDGL